MGAVKALLYSMNWEEAEGLNMGKNNVSSTEQAGSVAFTLT